MRSFWSGQHSVVGGSGAKRWLACPGSPALSAGGGASEPEEWTAEGIVAHDIVAQVLATGKELWEYVGRVHQVGAFEVEVTPEMAGHCQLYVDAVHGALPKGTDVRLYVEQKVSYAAFRRPEAYGTLDCCFIEPEGWGKANGCPRCEGSGYHSADPYGKCAECGGTGDEWRPCTLHVFDLKYGEGLFVSQHDPQFRYYAGAFVATNPELCADLARVKIYVVQPRIDWQGPKVRTLDISAAELSQWVDEVLLPGIDRTTEPNAPLIPGKEQCQFCPALARCPAQRRAFEAVNTQALTVSDPAHSAARLDDEELGMKLSQADTVRKFIRALEKEAFNRLQNGRPVPGWKLVPTKTNRVGKPGYEEAARQKWGNSALKPIEVKSIAQLEKLSGGKAFVTEWGYKPEGAPTLAPVADARHAIEGSRANPISPAFQQIIDKAAQDE